MLKNIALAILSGLLLGLAWPTYGFSLLIFVAFVPLFYVEHQLRQTRAKTNAITFLLAYLTFALWNTITTWWIWNATPAGGVFAIVINSLLMTIIFQLYHLIAKRKPLRFSLIALIGLWLGFEKFHHNWDFTWPWLTLGNVFSEDITWIQWYDYTGVFGGSLWILLVNAIVFMAVVHFVNNKAKKTLFKQLIMAMSLVVIGIFVSKYRYLTYKEKGIPIQAIALQPNTNPYTEKYNRSHDEIAEELIGLSLTQMTDTVDVVLAPETVFSTKVTPTEFENSSSYQLLQYFLERYPKVNLLMGIDLYQIFEASVPKTKTANEFSDNDAFWYESYNGAFHMAKNKQTDYYHKSKLVVGVEHFPFRRIIKPLLGNVMIDLGGTVSTLTPQKEPSVFTLEPSGIKIAPIICYESVYGEYVGRYVQKGASILGIVTNDSWWDRTQGYKQLLSYARLRAIEQRRSVVRSANSGVSAFIDQKGHIISRLDYETQGALKETVLANTQESTFYAKHGDFIARIGAFVGVLFFLVAFFVPKKK